MRQLSAPLHRVLRQSGHPVVYALHDVWLPSHLEEKEAQIATWRRPGNGAVRRTVKPLVRAAFGLADRDWLRPVRIDDVALDHIVFCSQYQRQRHSDAGLPMSDWRTIYNGIDVTRFDGEASFDGSRRLRVLFAGRLVESKGAHTAVAAMARMAPSEDIQLSIAGPATYPLEYAARLREDVARQGLTDRVAFLGFVSQEDLPSVYRAHDVLVHPTTHLEGLPMTLLEAMACQLAIVSSPSGGSAEILRDGENSLLVPAEQPDLLARALTRLRADSELLRRLARTGSKWARWACALDHVTDQTLEYLRGVADPNR
jgi:glycosyltransferase involved in cell wall biosynthesis